MSSEHIFIRATSIYIAREIQAFTSPMRRKSVILCVDISFFVDFAKFNASSTHSNPFIIQNLLTILFGIFRLSPESLSEYLWYAFLSPKSSFRDNDAEGWYLEDNRFSLSDIEFLLENLNFFHASVIIYVNRIFTNGSWR